MSKYIISLDQGTTSSRTVLVDINGDIIDINQKEIAQFYPKQGYVEEDANEIFNTQLYTLKECLQKNNLTSRDIISIGITNQRETTIVWDKVTGEPVYNAIVWQCKRSQEYCVKLEKRGYKELIRKKTGLIMDPYFSATKIMWLLDNIPNLRDRAKKGEVLFGTVDTWLLWKLTKGKSHFTDVSNASRTMMFNINTREWDKEILELLDIPASILPEVKETSYSFGSIDNSIIPGDIKINALVGDQQSALFGQLCTRCGEIKNTYGTGCFTLMNTGTKPVFNNSGLLTTIAWQINGECFYALEGSVFVGGAVIQWLRDELGIIKNASESEYLARSVEDNNGVTFVSTFQGIGTPYWNSEVSGELTGLTRSTKKGHIVRAALESIAFRSLEVITTMIKESGLVITNLKVDGGACKNNFLMEFQSDILDINIIRPNNVESTAMGAAFLAGLYRGFWKDIEEIKNLKKEDKIFKPHISDKKRSDLLKQWEKGINKALEE